MSNKDKTVNLSENEFLGRAQELALEGSDLSLHGVLYELVTRLGSGGNGGVVLARNKSAQKNSLAPWESEVVIKYAFEGKEDSVLREAEIMGKLQHPSLVRLIDSGSADIHFPSGCRSAHVLVEERLFENPYVFFGCDRQIPPSVAIDAYVNLLRAVEYVHSRRYVHGDIKPSNILLRANRTVKRGESRITSDSRLLQQDPLFRDRCYITMVLLGHWLPVLGDTGSATPVSEGKPERFDGTPAYAPLAALKLERNGIERDVYALTLSFAEMLTGTCPYAGFKDWRDILGAMENGVRPYRDIDSLIDRVCDRIESLPSLPPPSLDRIKTNKTKQFKDGAVRIIKQGIAIRSRPHIHDLLQNCGVWFDLKKSSFTDQDGKSVERLTQGIFETEKDASSHSWYSTFMRQQTRKLTQRVQLPR